MITLPTPVVTSMEEATAREWVVTNGLGGYAAGTVSGVATRRYHGLLVAARTPPRGRQVLVSHLDETVALGEHQTDLSVHAFPGTLHPRGDRHLVAFSLDPLPVWRWRIGEVLLERTVCMVHGQNTTVVRYTLVDAPSAIALRVQPFGAFRDFHHHARENGAARLRAELRPGRAVLRPYDDYPAVTVAAPGVFTEEPQWWRNFSHALEAERGLDHLEDLFTPGYFTLCLGRGESSWVVLSSEPDLPPEPLRCEPSARARLQALVPPDTRDPRVAALHLAVDAYRAECASPPALLAGHPWFEDWGRDTLIAFTGAYLVPRRFEEGRAVLAAFAQAMDRGMLPNRFPDAGGADYNTVDASLWFFHAARRYVHYTQDHAFLRDVLYPSLREIERWYRQGTRYGIHATREGLIAAGERGVQLTWMDAKVGDWVVTPRHGCPVEINALWHAGLKTLAHFAARLGHDGDAGAYQFSAEGVREAFRARFWNPSRGYLYDVVPEDPGAPGDGSVRPNALYAVALPGELLPPEQEAAVVSRARSDLLVPFGLRTLSPDDTAYKGHYRGDPLSRDGAYHQGTAWPFLLGVYASAVVRHAAREDRLEPARHEVLALYEWLPVALETFGLGHLPEVLDGDPPHRFGGCFAQAWSDCEALRAIVEDGYGRGPPDTL
ncbi:MAG: glycogen debranching enzyme N-terminal domain-containing protein [Deltaproteobacteria bacterium]|nr:glycogen debranching enzyme N-terminal domain-containing protein [Deltaproteobacteria bacterium]